MDMSLKAVGKTIIWSSDFKQAMEDLCAARSLPDSMPARLGAMPVRNSGLLLVWPLKPGEAGGHEVHASPRGRRVTTDLSQPLADLGANIPDGFVTEIPVSSYRHAKHGLCLALQLQKATFLYKESRASAIGLMDEFPDE